MKKLIAVLAAALATVSYAVAPAEAANTTASRITVSGTGLVTVKRDQATSFLTVSTSDITAKAAMASATRSFNTVRAAVLAAGAKEDDLATAGISLFPEYDYSNPNRPVITGYRASVSLNVTSSASSAAGIIDAAVEAGGDTLSIGGISFDTANTDAAAELARNRAVVAARAKALAYAKGLKMRLGKAVKVVEISAPAPAPVYTAAEKALAPGFTLDPGSSKVSVSVEITFNLS